MFWWSNFEPILNILEVTIMIMNIMVNIWIEFEAIWQVNPKRWIFSGVEASIQSYEKSKISLYSQRKQQNIYRIKWLMLIFEKYFSLVISKKKILCTVNEVVPFTNHTQILMDEILQKMILRKIFNRINI